jgi:hypothetical protein
MIFASRTRVRLTASELNRLRQDAARNGHAVNRIETAEQLLQATLDALPTERQEDLLRFLESDTTAMSTAARPSIREGC